MSRYQPYPTYKDSGVEWLREVPEHWSTYKGKRVFSNRREQAKSVDEQLAVTQKFGAIPQSLYMELEGQKVVLALKGTENFRHVSKKDFVISLRSFQGGIEYSEYEGCVSPAYTVLNNTKQITHAFYAYLFKSYPYIKALQSSTDSLREGKSITYEQFGLINIPLPEINEQTAIANFLDHEIAKIDTLIEKQQRLSELLKEKRQAVISHAVTKGLDPDAKMKQSGVEWLGEVPEHWKLPKIKWFAKTDSGGTPTTTKYKEYYENGIYPWIRTTDLNNAELFETPISITEKALKDTACNLIQPGSILVGMYGGAGTIGKHALLKFVSTINQAVCAITPDNRALSEYLHFFIQFYRPFWMVGAEGTRKDPNIGQETIREAVVIIPALQEQGEIVDYLDVQTTKIETLIEKAEKAITLLKERRTALISAAVTGKIDVREES